jgi:hypothetical protein
LQPRRVWIFVGPTIPASEIEEAFASQPADVRICPPIQQGDILRATYQLPDILAIIDGYFHQVPAIPHKEILFAMAHGVRVLGASSIGALRAAELDTLGMEGVGTIYRLFKNGDLDSDDEVAVRHAYSDQGYRSLTQPLVNIRHILKIARMNGVISRAAAMTLLRIAKRLHYTERTYSVMLREATRTGTSGLNAFREFVRAEPCDLKRDDARELLALIIRRINGEASPAPVAVPNHRTKYLRILERDYTGQFVNDRHIPDRIVLAFHRLLSPTFPEFLRQVSRCCLAVDEAIHRQLAITSDAYRLSSFRRKQGLERSPDYLAWLRRHFLTESELLAGLRDQALVAVLSIEYKRTPPRHEHQEFLEMVTQDVAARMGMEAATIDGPLFMRPGILWEEPLIREMKFQGRFAPALETAARVLDFSARYFDGKPQLKLTYDALAGHAHDALERWAMRRWKRPLRDRDRAMRERGFVRYAEFLEVARPAFLFEQQTRVRLVDRR